MGLMGMRFHMQSELNYKNILYTDVLFIIPVAALKEFIN
jgi:hypothetical protein